nr:uncharacterized protein LOC106678846 isoform X1 [Halyomorpha halys]
MYRSNRKIVVDIKSLLLVSIVKIIIIATCISGTVVLVCSDSIWLDNPAAYVTTSMGIIGQILMVLPMLISQLSEKRTTFLVVVCDSLGVATNIVAVACIYNIEFPTKVMLMDHHIVISVLSVIDLGILTLTINEGIFRKPITIVKRIM